MLRGGLTAWIPAFAGMTFLVLHVYLGMTAIRAFSPTYDEPVHLTAGVVALKEGNYSFNGYHHPPLGEMWAALPLVFSGVRIPVQDPFWIKQVWDATAEYQFADRFLYHNNTPADRILEKARMMQLLLSVIFLVYLTWTAFQLGGMWAGGATLGLACFSSALIAHGSLVSTDLAFSVFYFLFFSSLRFIRSRSGALVSGLFFGLCMASKFSAILIFPSLAAVGCWIFFIEKKRIIKIGALSFLCFFCGAGLALAVVYQLQGLQVFWDGMKYFFFLSQAGRSSFFFGHHNITGNPAYFPAAFLIKTEIPILLSLMAALVLVFKKHLRIPAPLWIPPLVYFAIASFSKVQIGHRHILPVYPFLFLNSGLALSALPVRWRNISIPVLVGWMGIEAFSVRPHFLAYFNQLVGGSENGYHYFTDSNLDWGQGLKEVGESLEASDTKNGIYLSYFGVADPHFYGIKYIDILTDPLPGHKDDAADASLSPTKFAISLTNLQSTYFPDKTLFDWMKKETPWKKIGHSIFIYDFSHHPEALAKINELRTRFYGSR